MLIANDLLLKVPVTLNFTTSELLGSYLDSVFYNTPQLFLDYTPNLVAEYNKDNQKFISIPFVLGKQTIKVLKNNLKFDITLVMNPKDYNGYSSKFEQGRELKRSTINR